MRLFKFIYFIGAISIGLNLAIISGALAQDTSEGGSDTRAPSDKNFRWGIKAGTTLNQFNQSGLTIGFNGGGFAKYYLIPLLDIQAELLYMMQGSGRDNYTRSSIGGNISSITYMNRAVSFQSVEIPLLAVIKLGSIEGMIRPKVLLGGSYGYCFAAFERHDKLYVFTNGTEGIVGNAIENVGGEYEQHQFDAIGGFGLDFNLSGGKQFIFDVRYNYGLNDVNLFKSPYVGGALYQNTLSINFGYAF
jgi:hypothetical protein